MWDHLQIRRRSRAKHNRHVDRVRTASRLGFEALENRIVLSATAPSLSSLPDASASLYLDFDGHFEATWGTHTNVSTAVFDIDEYPTTFSDDELAFITETWARVAEDYAPFNINVTTVEPAVLASGGPSSAANGVALRVAIGVTTSDDGFGGTSGGYS